MAVEIPSRKQKAVERGKVKPSCYALTLRPYTSEMRVAHQLCAWRSSIRVRTSITSQCNTFSPSVCLFSIRPVQCYSGDRDLSAWALDRRFVDRDQNYYYGRTPALQSTSDLFKTTLYPTLK